MPRPVSNVFQTENRLQRHMGLQVRLRDKGVAGEPKLPHLQHSPATEGHETALGDADDFPLDDEPPSDEKKWTNGVRATLF